MTQPSYDDEPIDEKTQIILQVLRDRREPMTTGDLRKQADLSQNQQVRYRITNKIPGLVEHAGQRETSGDGPDADLWTITDEGVEWVDEHAGDLDRAVDAAQAVDSLNRTRIRVDELQDTVEEFRKRIDGWQDTMDRRAKRLNQIESQTEDWKNELQSQGDEAWNKAHSAEQTSKSAEETASTVENQINALADDVDDLENSFEDLTNEINRKLEAASTQIDDVRTQAERAEQIARDARSEAQKSWTTRILERLGLR